MKHSIAIAKAKVRKRMGLVLQGPDSEAQLDHEVARVGIGVVKVIASLVAILGLAGLVAAMITAGSPLEVFRHWLGAVTGK